MPVAIRTKYAGPTNTQGSRIIATSQAGRTVTPYDDAINSDDNHSAAALAHLAHKFDNRTPLTITASGTLSTGEGVHIVGLANLPPALAVAHRVLADTLPHCGVCGLPSPEGEYYCPSHA